MRAIDLVVFDLVGTTIEDGGQVVKAFLGALRGNDLRVMPEELQTWRGASKRAVLRHFVEQRFGADDPDNAARVVQIYADFASRLQGIYERQGVRAIGGAEATFDSLRGRGTKVAVTTGFDRRLATLILQAVGWHQGVVDASVCSDEVVQGRPAPFMIFRAMEATEVTEVRRVVKVGDTVLDLQAGVNAGLGGVVGVLSGAQNWEQLSRVPQAHIIPSVAELPELLGRAFE